MKAYIMEMVGTFLLTLSVALTGNPLSFGLILVPLIYIGGAVSGGHYNPAVTLAITLNSSLPKGEFLRYSLSQIVGGGFAWLVYYLLTFTSFSPDSSGVAIPPAKIFAIEVIFTFLLCLVVLFLTSITVQRRNQLSGILIGLTLVGIAFVGGVYNPAVACVPMIIDHFVTGASLFNSICYCTGPLVGALFAHSFFKLIND
jgi:aquaporin Z